MLVFVHSFKLLFYVNRKLCCHNLNFHKLYSVFSVFSRNGMCRKVYKLEYLHENRSFFSPTGANSISSKSSKDATKQAKKKTESVKASELPKQDPENTDSPIKVKKAKKAHVISSSDEDIDNKSGSEPEMQQKESIKKRKSRLTKSESESSDEETTKKKIRTYGKEDKMRKRSVKKSDLDTSHSNESTLSDTETKTNSPKNESSKIAESATLHNFFGKAKANQPTPAKPASSPVKPEKTSPSSKGKPEKNSLSEETDDKSKPSVRPLILEGKVNVESYDPTQKKYHPIDDACWKRGEKVPYLALAKTLEAIEAISGRLKMIEFLANFLRSVIVLSPEDLLYCIYLCLNQLAPAYEGLELGVGDLVLMKAISQSTGQSVDSIKSKMAVKGDLGIIAEAGRSNQRTMFQPPKLTVTGVYEKLREIALMSGNASMSKKIDKIKVMLVACRQCEARYLIRSLSGKLRIGLAEQSLLAALAQAATLTPPEQDYPPEILNSSQGMSSDAYTKKLQANTLIVKTTYCECPSYDAIIKVLLDTGIDALSEHCKILPGIPIKPMLAHPTKGVQEVLQRFEDAKFTCEYKYDGERAQIHMTDKSGVHIYSRNQEDNTSKYPDVISRILKSLKPGTESFILDSEAVAWDKEKKEILPFQVLSTRKRKDAAESEIKVQVCIFAFDLLFVNGQSLVRRPYEERRGLLHAHFDEIPGEFVFVTSRDSDNVDDIAEFLDEAIKNKCEGLMVKTLAVDATYEIAKRSHNWLKLKKDYLEGVGDTLDLVVIGAYHGKGKRTGNYGGFLLACYDPDNEEFQTICKIGTGFKDEVLAQNSSFFKDHVIPKPKPYYCYDAAQAPDVWFDAVQVWEVKCADLSISPTHKAGIGIVDPEKGISLRFPRFIRIRDDKNPEDATDASQVARLYRSQEQVKSQDKGKKTDVEEDFY